MSSRGRQRRPQQPNRWCRVSVAVTTAAGTGLALPLACATDAAAATASTWNKVADCESDGNWTSNTGNGYYGGLQFAQATWKAYGGSTFAARADLASRAQQVAIGERVLRTQGPNAWPACSGEAGLTRGGDTAAAPRTHAEAAREHHAAVPHPVRTGTSAWYRVVSGDTLSGIARDRHIKGGWKPLHVANRSVIGDDPHLILPGQKLVLPGVRKASGAERTERTASPQTPAKESASMAGSADRTRSRTGTNSRTGSRTQSVGYVSPAGGRLGAGYRVSGLRWASGHHTGQDFLVPTGTHVRAVSAGIVVAAGWGGAYGYQVVIRHPDGLYTQYAHLSSLTVRAGQSVRTGTRVGRSGSTGNTTTPHLHFEVRTGPEYGSDIDPTAYLRDHGVNV